MKKVSIGFLSQLNEQEYEQSGTITVLYNIGGNYTTYIVA